MRLRINRWSELYEQSSEQKRYKKGLRWYAVPCDQEDGVGAVMIRDHEHGMAFMGMWNCLCKVSARLPIEQRGYVLRQNGTPHTLETLHINFKGSTLELWRDGIAFFCQPILGWLIDEEAAGQAAQPSKVAVMPLPKIEEPSIYEAAADRMIATYLAAGADKGKVMRQSLVVSALVDRLSDGPSMNHEEAIALIEDNIAEMLEAAKDLSKILRLDNFLRSGPCLLPRTGPKKYQRGSVEALIQTEVLAGRMTAEDARKQGVEL